MTPTIYIGADHAGFKLKEKIKKYLDKENIKYEDLGNQELNLNDDYPDIGFEVAEKVAKSQNSKGILICGTSFGVCIAANKIKGVRAVSVHSESEAKISREHNDANILCLPGGQMLEETKGLILNKDEIFSIIKTWLNTEFSKKERHERRLEKILQKENELYR